MTDRPLNILILFYSFTGGVAELARHIAAGAQEVPATVVTIKRIPEIIPEEVFEKHPRTKQLKEQMEKEFPLATIDDLIAADGVAFGTPTHFGSFASQVKHFIDQMTPAWLQGKLVNKPAAVFCTAGSTHGGEELALLSLMIPLLNLGMIPVGIPYPIQGESSDFDAGSPYGAVYVTGGGKKMSEADKKVARLLGARLAKMARLLNCSCQACSLGPQMRQALA